MARTERGLFITFEGIEGSGKSTQVKLLAEAFEERGLPVVSTWEPGGTRISNEIRDILLNPEYTEMDARAEALLYAASRAQHVAEVIRPALDGGSHVLCDRYLDSSLAYQGYARGISLDVLSSVNEWATQNIVPDLTIFLDLDVEEGLERATAGFADRFEQEELEFHRRVRAGYLELEKDYPKRFRRVHVDSDTAAIHKKVLAMTEEIVGAML